MAQKKKKGQTKWKWDACEAQAFRDGCRRKAQTFADRRKQESKMACRGKVAFD